MDSDTRAAHRRIGAVAIAAFLALLLLGLNRGPASANQGSPAASPTAEPSQQIPDFDRDHDGRGPRRGFDGGGPGFGGGDDGGGGAPAPSTPATPSAPSTGATTT
jgi:hypothetical protein